VTDDATATSELVIFLARASKPVIKALTESGSILRAVANADTVGVILRPGTCRARATHFGLCLLFRESYAFTRFCSSNLCYDMRRTLCIELRYR